MGKIWDKYINDDKSKSVFVIYVDELNLHIMNDGSGSMVGCMCR